MITAIKATVKERPIIFSADSVRLIKAGLKTQTRRVVKPQPIWLADNLWFGQSDDPDIDEVPNRRWWVAYDVFYDDYSGGNEAGYVQWRGRNPYGEKGDYLWVKENAYISQPNFCSQADATHPDGRVVGYAADMGWDAVRCATDYGVKLTPCIFMPRWASRFQLQITEIKINRLLDITNTDAEAEGITQHRHENSLKLDIYNECYSHEWDNRTSRENYLWIWNRLNAKRGFPAESNPWVWVVTFEKR